MKKNSKAVERHPAETIGVDLGDKMSKYAVLNEEGVVVEEGSFPQQRGIHCETLWRTEQSESSDGSGHAVGVDCARVCQAGPRSHRGELARVEVDHIVRYEERPQRRGEAGAAGARRPQSAWLRWSIARRSSKAELAVIRARDALVRTRTLLVNTARSLAKGFGLRLPSSITHTFGARALARLAEDLRTAMSGLLEQRSRRAESEEDSRLQPAH